MHRGMGQPALHIFLLYWPGPLRICREEGPRAKHGLECSGYLSFTGPFSFQRVNCWSINLCAPRGLLGHPDPFCLHGPCRLASTGLGILSLLSPLHHEGWKVRSNFSLLPLIGGLCNNGRIISMDVGLSSFLRGRRLLCGPTLMLPSTSQFAGHPHTLCWHLFIF